MSKSCKIILELPDRITPQVEQTVGKLVLEKLLVEKCSLVGIELDKSKGKLKSALDKLVKAGKIPKPVTKHLAKE
jgi:hypothetical protein